MKSKLLLLPFVAISMIACSPSDDKKAAEKVLLPSEKIKIEKADPLTAEQIAMVKESRLKAEKINLIKELIEHPSDSTESESKREQKLKDATAEQKVVNEDIKKHCLIQNEIPRKSGNAKKAGDKMTTESDSSIKGPACAVNLLRSSSEEQTIISSNFSELEEEFKKTQDKSVFDKLAASTSAKMEKSSSMKVTSPLLQEASGRISEFTKSQSTVAIKIVGTKIVSATQSSSQTGETILSSGDKIKISMQSDSSQQESSQDIALTLKAEFPTFKVVIQMVKTANSEKAVFYLNGEPKTPEELAEIGFEINAK